MRYLMGHLRGAVNVPFKKLQGPDGRLGAPEQLAAAFGDAGLGDDITPVLYDHQDGRNAAMAAWVLEYLGRTDVHVMDLLFDAWKGPGPRGPLPARPNGAKTLSATPQPVGAGYSRRRGQHRRDETPGYPLPGGIPGPNGHGPSSRSHSRRRQRSALGNGRRRGKLLIEPELLRERLAAAGITPRDAVVAYCRSGVRASLAYLSMQQAGYNVRLYDGSYAEWMDSGQPVEI